MSSVYFSATKLPALGKQGKILPDADGYYELVVGGLNCYNNTKSHYYLAEGAKELFGPGSLLHRRVANGCLRAEVGHPTRRPNESMDSFISRMLDIDRDNVCAHFKEIWLDFDFGKKNPHYKNPDLIAIMAKVKPSQPKGHILQESLDNPNENVCFSIRATADEGYQRGRKVRVLKEVIAIDFVNEGGILVASKWDSPATESASNSEISMILTESILKRVSSDAESVFATESSRELASYLTEKHFKKPSSPIYTRW